MAKATTLEQLELHALKSANYTDKQIAKLAEDVADAIEDTANNASKAVNYTKQTLTEEQQAQARDNIGAVGADDISGFVSKVYLVGVFEELKTAIAESNIDAAVAILDEAILDLSALS
jgi:hypothetical protein